MPRPSLGHTHTQSPTLAFSECSSYDTDHPVATHAHILTCFGSSETTKNSNQVQCRPSTGHSPNQSPIGFSAYHTTASYRLGQSIGPSHPQHSEPGIQFMETPLLRITTGHQVTTHTHNLANFGFIE